MRRDDWLLAQLPVGMVEDDFFVRFVSIFQHVATTIMEDVDNLENVVDVTVAPTPMVRWLGSWIGVDSVDASLPHDVQRKIVRTSAKMLAWRGTGRGLRQFLELMSGGLVEIEDSGGVFAEGTAPMGPPWVRARVESTGWMPEADFITLVRDEVPAHVALELWVGNRRIWPQQPPPEPSTPRPGAPIPGQRPDGSADGAPERSFAPPWELPETRAPADERSDENADARTDARTDEESPS